MVSEEDIKKIVVVIGLLLIGYFAFNTIETYATAYMTVGITALVVGLLLLGGALAYRELTQ